MCTKESLQAYKSLDVYNYTLCWIEELFPLGILNIFHLSLLQFAQFTAQQLLIIASHHLSLQYCLFSATCLCNHLTVPITEVLMIGRAKVVISFSLLFSHSCLPLSLLLGYFTSHFTVSADKFSGHSCEINSLFSFSCLA